MIVATACTRATRFCGLLVAALCLVSMGQYGLAQTPTRAKVTSKVCWINVANGQPVPPEAVIPVGTHLSDPMDPNHATNPGAGPAEGFPNGVPSVTYVRLDDGSWINSANGTPVPDNALVPVGTHLSDPMDPNHATNPGAGPAEGFPNGVPSVTYVRVPCPP